MVQGVEIVNNEIINRNPATGEIIAKIPCTSFSEIPTMIQNSKIAQQTSWSTKLSLRERVDYLRKALKALQSKKEELTALITKEMGKIKSEAEEEVDLALFEQEELLKLVSEANEDVTKDNCTIVRQAHGVVAILAPWNFPILEIILLALPALGAGNTIIIKPSEVTPLCGGIIATTLAENLPENVVQLAQGDGNVGKELVKYADMVAMTGSSKTGKQIMESCSAKLKPIILELGGKDPMIVFEDANLQKAAKDAVLYSLSNAGQVCCAVERVYVQDEKYDEFQEMIVSLAKDYKVGNGFEDESKVGPMVSKLQHDIVQSHVNKTLEQGGKLLYQSETPKNSEHVHYFPVTVLSDLTQDMMIQQQETFGPIIALSKFKSEQEAIELANDSEYGLTSYVYTNDLKRGKRVAMAIQSGQVGINCYSPNYADAICPWVGHKGSGYGFHSGLDGLRQFSLPKSLVWDC